MSAEKCGSVGQSYPRQLPAYAARNGDRRRVRPAAYFFGGGGGGRGGGGIGRGIGGHVFSLRRGIGQVPELKHALLP